ILHHRVTTPADLYTFSLHDALPICQAAAVLFQPESPVLQQRQRHREHAQQHREREQPGKDRKRVLAEAEVVAAEESPCGGGPARSEEHTSELQSRENLVCRLLLEKK